jgi:hypothetical protein
MPIQGLQQGTVPATQDPVGFSNRGIPMAWWQAAQMQERMRLDAQIQYQQMLQQQHQPPQQPLPQQQQLDMQQQQLAMQQQQQLQPMSDQDLISTMGPQITPNGGENWIIPESPAENTIEHMREWIRSAYQQLLTNHSPQEAVSKILETARLSGNPAMEQMVMEESATFAPMPAPPQ